MVVDRGETVSIECYAQRLLNPFRGTMQVIKYASAEAVSTDGLYWDIYVSNDELRRGLEGQVQTSDIRYGSWSASAGLKRGPLYPSADFRRMEAMGAVVYAHLLTIQDRLPFPLRDHYELWLLDRQARPLALLDSALTDQDLALDRPLRWRPGMAAEARFLSAEPCDLAGRPAASVLAEGINAAAGQAPAAQWFRREADGTGWGLEGVNLTPDLPGRRLAAGSFPDLLLACCPDLDGRHRRLLDDFLAWQAAWLLTLPLSASMRRDLEAQAHRQAELVEGLWRLYPAMIDTAAINAARVEAQMLRAQAVRGTASQEQMSTFYIELNPAGGNYT
jgi:hypothetical protein